MMLRKIICFILIILMTSLTPLSSLVGISQYIYAASAASAIESEIFEQTLIPTLITLGLVFKTKEAAEKTVYDVKDWLYDNGFDWQMPEDPKEPDGPKMTLGDALVTMTVGKVIYDSSIGKFKQISQIPKALWYALKSWVDENFNVGLTEIITYEGWTIVNPYEPIILDFQGKSLIRVFMYRPNSSLKYDYHTIDSSYVYLKYIPKTGSYNHYVGKSKDNVSYTMFGNHDTNPSHQYNIKTLGYIATDDLYVTIDDYISVSNIIAKENIVDNPDADFNNQYTGDKIVVVPLKKGIDGRPVKGPDGFYLPSVETEEWVDVQPEEIPEMNPTGIPQEEAPEIPQPEEDDSKDTGILITIATILATLLSQITGIRNDTATIADNMPSTEGTGSGGTGDITDIPTDFDWGNIRRFFDVIFIFIYFIVILILILVKLLDVVFLSLAYIPANSELFNSYPTLKAGLDFVMNVGVGGLTVYSAFQYVFMFFFFIFIVKQLRKLYESYVYEENERDRNAKKKSNKEVF